MLGNVAEWCESLTPEMQNGTLVPSYTHRYALGEDWTAEYQGRTLVDAISSHRPEDSHAHYTRGFRCVQSAY